MSVSIVPARVAAVRGETVSCRHYVQRFRCPTCQKRYAKRTLFLAHVKACAHRAAR